MAFEDDMRVRRQRRDAHQASRQRSRQFQLLALVGVGLLLVAGILGLIFSGLGNGPEPGSTADPQTPDTTQSQENTVIHFVAGGDVIVTDRTTQEGLDYTEVFQDVLSCLAQGDLTAVNFEGNLVGAPYGAAQDSAPQAMMEALRAAGVDLVQMANSRSVNNGVSGLETTLSAIRSAGMEPVGAFADAEEFRKSGGYTIREIQGIRVAIVAFTKGLDGKALPEGYEDCVNLLYKDYASTYQTVDSAGIKAVLANVAQEQPDLTIALLHWGSEFNDEISSTQKTIVELMKNNGVDAIVGTHPHYVQKMSLDENGFFVAYSLGDLLGDADRSGSDYSVILDLEITKDHVTGETRVTDYSYTPIYNLHGENQPPKVVRIRQAMAAYDDGFSQITQEVYDQMAYSLLRIEARTAGE